MANTFDLVVGLDPGISGGMSFIFVDGKVQAYPIPVRHVMVNKKNKKTYDLPEIVSLLKCHALKRVLFVQERVSSHPGEGSTAAFNFGKSAGSTIGIATALGFTVVEVSSQTWKKHFPELNIPSILAAKEEIRKIRSDSKTLKDKAVIKANKKETDRLNRQIKTEAKATARELVSEMYPDIASLLLKKNSDGVAESILIARYGRDKQNELVQRG